MPGPVPPLPRKLAVPRKKVRVVSARQKVKSQTPRRLIEEIQATTTEFLTQSTSGAKQAPEPEKPEKNTDKPSNQKTEVTKQQQTQVSAS